MDIGSSKHKNSPWRITSNYLTQFFTSFPLLKWGISNKLRILVFTNPATHCFGFNTRYPNNPPPWLSIYTCCENYGNFLVSDMSWSSYHNLLTHPSKLGVAYTPYGMHRKMIKVSGCLWRDCKMGCFPFRGDGMLDFLAPSYISYHPDYGFLVIYSSFTSSFSVDPTIVCDLGP